MVSFSPSLPKYPQEAIPGLSADISREILSSLSGKTLSTLSSTSQAMHHESIEMLKVVNQSYIRHELETLLKDLQELEKTSDRVIPSHVLTTLADIQYNQALIDATSYFELQQAILNARDETASALGHLSSDTRERLRYRFEQRQTDLSDRKELAQRAFVALFDRYTLSQNDLHHKIDRLFNQNRDDQADALCDLFEPETRQRSLRLSVHSFKRIPPNGFFGRILEFFSPGSTKRGALVLFAHKKTRALEKMENRADIISKEVKRCEQGAYDSFINTTSYILNQSTRALIEHTAPTLKPIRQQYWLEMGRALGRLDQKSLQKIRAHFDTYPPSDRDKSRLRELVELARIKKLPLEEREKAIVQRITTVTRRYHPGTEALFFASHLDSEEECSQALLVLVKKLLAKFVDEEVFELAKKSADKIHDHALQVEAYVTLVDVLLRMKEFQKALEMTQEKLSLEPLHLRDIASRFASFQQFDKALLLASSLRDPMPKNEAFQKIALELVSRGELDKAIAITQKISDPDLQKRTLLQLKKDIWSLRPLIQRTLRNIAQILKPLPGAFS